MPQTVFVTQGSDAGGGLLAWSNPGNITAEDGTNATSAATGVTSDTNNLLGEMGTPNAVSIPGDATITGIQIEIKMAADASLTAVEKTIKIAKTTGTYSTNLGTGAAIPATTLQWVSYGGDGVLGGLTLTPTDVAGAHFGASFIATATSGLGTISVDAIRITIYYTIPGTSRGCMAAF